MVTYIIQKEQSLRTKKLYHTLSKLYPYKTIYVHKSYKYERYIKDAMIEIVSDAIQSGYECIKVLDGCTMELHNAMEIDDLMRGVPYNFNIVVIEAKNYAYLKPYNDLCSTIRGANNIIGMFIKNSCFNALFEGLYEYGMTFDDVVKEIKNKYALNIQSQLLKRKTNLQKLS